MSASYRVAVTVFAVVLANCGVGFGQTGSLNPNPLLPSGVGSGTDVDPVPRGGGRIGIGRGVGPGGTLDANPADILLKDINGTNNGRRTGSYIFKQSPRRTSGYRGVTPKFEDGAVLFTRRGTYEEAIYGSRPGSYGVASKTSKTSKTSRSAP
ncbi:MAG TPA: hypothetical protein VG125_26880 [Pirellulales bacterium]|jgi:hypothetical protein|nr:hypothetical protein [Pirellulales bacterium]